MSRAARVIFIPRPLAGGVAGEAEADGEGASPHEHVPSPSCRVPLMTPLPQAGEECRAIN
jgi:hypothetical protein